MKTFVKIIVLLGALLFTYNCTRSTEQKMIRQIRSDNYYNRSRIVNLKIINIIHQGEVDSALKADTLRLSFLKEKYNIFNSRKDSLRRSHRPEHIDIIKMKYIKSIFDSLGIYDRWIEMVNKKSQLYETININYNEKDISGYRVLVHYKNGRTNNLILTSDYHILCPSFMLEPVDSIFKFRSNMMRRPNRMEMNIPRPNIPQIRREPPKPPERYGYNNH